MRRSPRLVFTAAAAVVGLCASPGFAGFYDEPQFVAPAHWSPGDGLSTHQFWDDFTTASEAPPDVHVATPGVAGSPVLTITGNGFMTGPGRAYSFNDHYDIFADVRNVGSAASVGSGTHVIIQVASTVNPDFGSVLLDTIRLVDLDGASLPDGENENALRADHFGARIVPSAFGDVEFQESIIEFFLPGYTSDFRVTWSHSLHAGFDALRIDTIASAESLPTTAIPEPTSLTLAALAAGLVARRRRRAV